MKNVAGSLDKLQGAGVPVLARIAASYVVVRSIFVSDNPSHQLFITLDVKPTNALVNRKGATGKADIGYQSHDTTFLQISTNPPILALNLA